MNSFLGGCCFEIKDDDKSTPSFIACPQLNLTNKSSLFSLCTSRGVVYEAWIDSDFSTKNNALKQSSSTSDLTRSSTRLRSYKSKNKSEDDLLDRSCYWIDKDDCESSICSTAYGHSMPKLPIKRSSKILDMISKWFWKCSPGCQQIPPIN